MTEPKHRLMSGRDWIAALLLLSIPVAEGVLLLRGGGAGGDAGTASATLSLEETLGGADTVGYARAMEPRPFVFPEDHGPHPDFRSEWWYFTGNLEGEDGARYGFQFTFFRVGLVTTGSEVYHGRIEDAFGPVIQEKIKALGSQVIRQILVSDDQEMTVAAIHALIAEGAEMVMVTGGMSVDPDDQTPASIRAAGGDVITYGAPVFPGAMFMLATIDGIPVAGLPGCVMYYQASIFDLVVPRLLAGETVSREDIATMGHGGFCSGCKRCRYPLCGFGKG